MTTNYLSLNEIIEKNEGKGATYKMESYTDYGYGTASAILAFENGDKIRFYYFIEKLYCLEWIKYKSFCEYVYSIELKTKEYSNTEYESATKTKLFINGKNYSTWIAYGKRHYDKSISWELVTTEQALTEEERIRKEKRRDEEERLQAEKKESDRQKIIEADKAFSRSPEHADYSASGKK
jgi:hypothetical protein